VSQEPAIDQPAAGSWYAVHTRSRHERKVLAALTGLQLQSYLPEYRTWSRRKDRRQRIERPLFPGYLFVRASLDAETRLRIVRAPSVVRIVGTAGTPTPVPDHEVESIMRLLGAAPDSAPEDRLVSGQQVQVMDGPLRGVVGRIQQTRRGQRIVVSVELLGRSVAADLQASALEPYLE
jgi:transcription termination/antitermination protein NusG